VSEADAYSIFSSAIWVILIASGPVLAIATLVGLGIAFFQALTQIQEMTLTFVPKIAAIFRRARGRSALHVRDAVASVGHRVRPYRGGRAVRRAAMILSVAFVATPDVARGWETFMPPPNPLSPRRPTQPGGRRDLPAGNP
jgi:hypothetical protein